MCHLDLLVFSSRCAHGLVFLPAQAKHRRHRLACWDKASSKLARQAPARQLIRSLVTRFASEANVHRRENDYGQEKIAKKKNTALHKEVHQICGNFIKKPMGNFWFLKTPQAESYRCSPLSWTLHEILIPLLDIKTGGRTHLPSPSISSFYPHITTLVCITSAAGACKPPAMPTLRITATSTNSCWIIASKKFFLPPQMKWA
jgi:hypothetical protein